MYHLNFNLDQSFTFVLQLNHRKCRKQEQFSLKKIEKRQKFNLKIEKKAV